MIAMPIIVKKPFSIEDIRSEGIKDINTKDINAANRVEQVHPEFEEKPIMATTQTSEETHGGSELTFSLPKQQQNSVSSPNNADTNNDNAADNSDNKDAQEQQNAGGEKSNDNNETSDADRQSNEGGGNNTQEPQSTATDTNQSAQEQENANGDTNNTNADDGSNQGQENGDDNEQNSENDGEDEESESEDTNEQAQSGTYNTQQVVDVIAVSASSKYYQTEFWRFIEMIAEEKTRAFDPMGSEEYNVKKLMFRQFEKKPLNSYKMSRVREAVIILLDNSGSMMWWSDNLQVLADLAMQRNDVEVYLAPNGHIEEMLYPKHQVVNHDDVMKRLRNRKIIYVGDFDGADTPIELSLYNDVIWICPEERYIRFLEHDWVHYDESRYKGAFLRVFTLQELFSAFKKLLSMPALRFWYDLCNKTHRCGGDEE